MDSYDQFGRYNHGDKNVQNARKVYVNPNFQRSCTSTTQSHSGITTLVPQTGRSTLAPHNGRSTFVPQNGSMYLNPKFHKNTHNINLQPPKTNKPKIYINPNFVRVNTTMSTVSDYYTTPVATTSFSSYYGMPNAPTGNAGTITPMLCSYYNSTLNTYYVNSKTSTVTSTSSLQLPNVTPKVIPQSTLPVAAAKSRYSLIRQNKNAISNVRLDNTSKPVTKMKISKYKTVSLEHVKKLQTQNDRPLSKVLPKTNDPAVADKSRTDFTNSRFKFVKNNTATKARKQEFKTQIKRKSINSSKIMLGSSQKLKMRVDITKFKKNNIPCPLFRKYGTCLRNSRGKCEFLHDKKHVSICRKFLKGVCHEKNCLLSHEVTAEKMPTCSFYLNGMCTREDCPYLHVKLNEKTKICLDFLKGYCEKGNECLNRHVNICPDQAIKGSCLRKKCPYPHRTNKKTYNIAVNKANTKKYNQYIKLKINKKISKTENIAVNSSVQSSDKVEENKDGRYYKEVAEDSAPVEVEVIKPTRCKLGALPSFIQL